MSESKEYLSIDRPETTNRDKDIRVVGDEDGVWIFEGNGEVKLDAPEANKVMSALEAFLMDHYEPNA